MTRSPQRQPEKSKKPFSRSVAVLAAVGAAGLSGPDGAAAGETARYLVRRHGSVARRCQEDAR